LFRLFDYHILRKTTNFGNPDIKNFRVSLSVNCRIVMQDDAQSCKQSKSAPHGRFNAPSDSSQLLLSSEIWSPTDRYVWV